MTTELEHLDLDSLHATFNTWAAEEESLDAQLSESLAALAAYQSHLDEWQRQLADERTALIQAREQFERDQAAAAASLTGSSAEASAELTAARQKIADLTASLVARTEELRTLDSRRAEVVNELKLSRAREIDLTTALDEQKRLLEHSGAAPSLAELSRPAVATNRGRSDKSGAVLGSIVEQFGKLRQQRAVDRQGSKKTR
jgi:hypothetical protein